MIDPGTIFAGRYEVCAHIGQGGMQDVYRATDLRIDQDVVLKTPLAGQQHRRFRASAQIAAHVNHHNIAKTYDYFKEEGIPYLIEEFVDGETLDEALLGKAYYIDPHLGARLFQYLAKGVAASHHANVVHRDLKPSNIMVSGGFNLYSVKITDFGIATFTEEVFEEAANAGDLTRSTSGTVKGALPYMAPEMMFRSPGEHPGAAIDIWALGALMFRMLTGEYPFGAGFEAPANIKLKRRATWPAFMTTSLQFSPLSQSLQELVEKCLGWDPCDRPTADHLVKLCEELCYFNAPRDVDRVANTKYSGAFGFIELRGKPNVFFNSDSVYGDRKATNDTQVSFSSCPGAPQYRAHPVIVLK